MPRLLDHPNNLGKIVIFLDPFWSINECGYKNHELAYVLN